MTPQVRFATASDGWAVPHVSSPFELIGDLLRADFPNLIRTTELLAFLEAVAEGTVTTWEGTGNATHLKLCREWAEIEDIWTETRPPIRVPLDDLRTIVSQWHSYLDQRSDMLGSISE